MGILLGSSSSSDEFAGPVDYDVGDPAPYQIIWAFPAKPLSRKHVWIGVCFGGMFQGMFRGMVRGMLRGMFRSTGLLTTGTLRGYVLGYVSEGSTCSLS